MFDAADDGDAAAKAVLDRYYDYVAAGITNLVNILSPEMVLIGGGISRQGERLLAPSAATWPPTASAVRSVPSR